MKLNQWVRGFAFLWVMFAAVEACSTSGHAIATGSETNWLSLCGSDLDCKVGHCVCGACTLPCSDNSECPGEVSQCETNGSAAFTALCETAKTPGVCLKECADGGSCAVGTHCVDNACVPQKPLSTASTPSLTNLFTDSLNTGTLPDGGATSTPPCLPQKLVMSVCEIAELSPTACDCSAAGLAPLDAAILTSAVARLRGTGICDATGTPACATFCGCKVNQFAGSALDACLNQAGDLSSTGWCYVDPSQGQGSDPAVATCPGNEKRRLRIEVPEKANPITITCSSTTTPPPPLLDAGTPKPLGGPCIPVEEDDPGSGGFDLNQISINGNAVDCQSTVCLIHQFQGRVSCPYGQTASPNADGETCTTPNGATVTVPVAAQLIDRPPSNSVYCTCHCAGPGPGPFCACPTGFACSPLIDGSQSDPYAGSYCTKNTDVLPADPSSLATGATCDAVPIAQRAEPPPVGCGGL
jgi:hypothetical protein